jgi:hypothetical protein
VNGTVHSFRAVLSHQHGIRKIKFQAFGLRGAVAKSRLTDVTTMVMEERRRWSSRVKVKGKAVPGLN